MPFKENWYNYLYILYCVFHRFWILFFLVHTLTDRKLLHTLFEINSTLPLGLRYLIINCDCDVKNQITKTKFIDFKMIAEVGHNITIHSGRPCC